jgi:uncharacterized protein (TIGR00251 family)
MKDAARIAVRDSDDGALVPVKVVPSASRDRIAGVLGDMLKITTSAPPEKGRANAAVAKIIAASLGIDRRGVRITGGKTGARKQFRIASLTADEVVRRLQEH